MAESSTPNPEFRLMDLDYWCRRQLISHWDIQKQIAFSHCSKESFNLVKSLNQKPPITISLDGWEWITVDVGDKKFLIQLVDKNVLYRYHGYATPINFGLSARDAFVHLCEMYHHKELTIHLNPESRTPLDAVRNVIDGFAIEKIICSGGTNFFAEKDYIKNMLEFLPTPKILEISESPFNTYEELRDNVLQFEYETLILQYTEEIDLLDIKSINTEIHPRIPWSLRTMDYLTTEEFQGFIEQWIKSEIYPKFKKIVVHAGVERNYQERILDGLLYQQLPNDWKCESCPSDPISREHMTVNGIYEVQQEADGQKAVICFESFGQEVLWKFFVV